MYFRQEHPTAFRAILGTIAAAILLGLVGGGIWAATRNSDAPRPPSADRPIGGSSTCGLPPGDQEQPQSGPDASWAELGRFDAPSDPKVGPGRTKDGIRTCFARSPKGALFAAANLTNNDADVDQVAYVEARIARGPLYAKYLAAVRKDAVDHSDDGALTRATVAGFRIISYDPSSARIEVVYRAVGADGEAGYLGIPMHLVWQGGDWKLYLDSLNEGNNATTPASLAGYTAWSSGESESLEPRDDGSGTTASAALGRAAPAWDRAAVPVVVSQSELPCVPPICQLGKGVKKLVTAPTEIPGDVLGSVASNVGGSAFDAIAQKFVDAQNWVLRKLMTGWMELPDPDVSSSGSVTQWLDARLGFLVALIMVAAVFITAYRLAVSGQFEHVQQLGAALARTVITLGIVGTAIPLALEAGNSFSTWIIKQSNTSIYKDGLQFQGMTNSALLMFCAGFIILIQFFQLAIMVIRSGSIIYLTAVIGLFAAGSNTKVGQDGFQRAVAWLIAFILYKPVAALVYAGAFQMTANKNVITQLTGVFMMLLSLVALPALMKLIVPAVAALGGANAGALAGATVGAAVATGAVMATGGVAGFAGAGAGGSAAASTAGGAGGSGMASGATQPPSPPDPDPTSAAPQGAGGGGGNASGDTGFGGSPEGASGGSVSAGDAFRAMGHGANMGGNSSGVAEGAISDEDEQ